MDLSTQDLDYAELGYFAGGVDHGKDFSVGFGLGMMLTE
jgi:hypothetical protein